VLSFDETMHICVPIIDRCLCNHVLAELVSYMISVEMGATW